MVSREIIRQVGPEEASRVIGWAQFLIFLIWTVCFFAILVSGRTLPTWVFLNSLQLVTHLVLFYSQLPPIAALFLG